MVRYIFLITVFTGILFSTYTVDAKPSREITVYHSEHCGCCKKWMSQLERNDFKVTSRTDKDLTAVKSNLKVPRNLSSCHTAIVDGYVIEGHVPIQEIIKLLQAKKKVRGIAVAGMPMGSPGMESSITETYSVSSFTEDGIIGESALYEGNREVLFRP